MNTVIAILETELKRINRAEQRDDKVRFNPVFIKEKKGLYWSMCLLFVITLALLIWSDIFSALDVWLCVLVFVVLNGFFFFHINPSYRLEDIDKTAWKNCYTGEWFRELDVQPAVLEQIMNSDEVSPQQKAELQRRLGIKQRVHFVDIRDIALLSSDR
ncbi:inner membrane protein YlaC [Salmonella enterica subsp. enterica serovar Choleraesuis]|nr:inner membrane protein YlaC [Salmonella enterica subsp. enterica serovar Choleraesuis]